MITILSALVSLLSFRVRIRASLELELIAPISPPIPESRQPQPLNEKYVFTLHTRPTPTQQRAFELLGINPDRTQ